MFTVRATNSSMFMCMVPGESSGVGSECITMWNPSKQSSALVMCHMMLSCGHQPPIPLYDSSLKNMNCVSHGMRRPIKCVQAVLVGFTMSSRVRMPFKSLARLSVSHMSAESQNWHCWLGDGMPPMVMATFVLNACCSWSNMVDPNGRTMHPLQRRPSACEIAWHLTKP